MKRNQASHMTADENDKSHFQVHTCTSMKRWPRPIYIYNVKGHIYYISRLSYLVS